MIDPIQSGHLPSLGKANVQRAKSFTSPNSGEPKHVTSSLASAISTMVKQGLPVDTQHIAAVRKAITAGEYPVDARRIAEQMLRFDNPETPAA
jgi:flagellar biosynthesis anti-sigma factor FlgM